MALHRGPSSVLQQPCLLQRRLECRQRWLPPMAPAIAGRCCTTAAHQQAGLAHHRVEFLERRACGCPGGGALWSYPTVTHEQASLAHHRVEFLECRSAPTGDGRPPDPEWRCAAS